MSEQKQIKVIGSNMIWDGTAWVMMNECQLTTSGDYTCFIQQTDETAKVLGWTAITQKRGIELLSLTHEFLNQVATF